MLNIPLFIARRMQQHKQHKVSVSARIINIATVAVSLGVCTMLIAVATGKGLQKEIRNKAVAFNGHIHVTPFENNESQISVLPFENSAALRTLISDQRQVTACNAFAIKAGMLRTDSDFEGILFKGVEQGYHWKPLASFLIAGRFPENDNETTNEILLSSVIASRLSLQVGDRADVFFQNRNGGMFPFQRRFTIVGLFYSGFAEIDENLVYGSLGQIQQLNRWQPEQIGGYEIFVNDVYQAPAVSEAIYNTIPSHLDSVPLTEQYATIFQWIALFDFNILIIILVMLFVGIINMATALLVMILERSRMIGVLKALGSGNPLIQKLFLYNGVAIMLRGLFWGNLLGLLFYFSQKHLGWIRLDPETYYVAVAPVRITFFEILGVNALFLIVCALLLWIPSKIVMQIDPAKVLRTR